MKTAHPSARVPVAAAESLWKLRVSMIGTFAVVTALATLIFVAVTSYLGMSGLGFAGILGFVVFFHVIQWLIGPYLIGAVYRAREIDPSGQYGWLHGSVDRLTSASGLGSKPKIMLAQIGIPNAFAYGSPLSGPRVAVTQGLVQALPQEEVEAVIGHELGHLKHRDVLVMMMISIIPAIVYYIGYSLYFSGFFGGGRGRSGGIGALLPVVGIGLIVFSFLLNFFVFYMSRLREYYADSHSARVIPGGARNLQRALVRIMQFGGKLRRGEGSQISQFKMFFIADPEAKISSYGDVDRVVEEVKGKKPSLLVELFSTHPHPAKRLRHLDRFVT